MSEKAPEKVWLPLDVVRLAEVSPELKNVEGAWYVNAEELDKAKAAVWKEESALHLAVCQAVGLLNFVIHKQEKSRQAHNILRQALIDYADAAALAVGEIGEKTKG